MVGNHGVQWIALILPLFFFERSSPSSCVQQNIRINGESETSLPTRSSAQCEEECLRKRCPAWTWEGGQCQVKRRGKEGSKVGSRGAVSGTEEAGCSCISQLHFLPGFLCCISQHYRSSVQRLNCRGHCVQVHRHWGGGLVPLSIHRGEPWTEEGRDVPRHLPQDQEGSHLVRCQAEPLKQAAWHLCSEQGH